MKGNYNKIAPYFDQLSRIVFGNEIVNAQKFLVKEIPENSKILVVGGGTGWILEEIAKTHAGGLQITYVESSQKMLSLSMKRKCGFNRVVFINEAIQCLQLSAAYDIAITPFVFDNFKAGTANVIFNKIDQHLVNGGLWLFADFQVCSKNKFWQIPLLKIMYLFFRIVCNIEAITLPDTNTLFTEKRYSPVSSKFFFRNFIHSVTYRKEA